MPKGWQLKPLGTMCSKIGSGATPRGGSAVYTVGGTAFVRSQNVFDHEFSRPGLVFIDDESASRLDGVALQPGDVLLNITGDGDTIARCCVVPDNLGPARVSQHVMIVRASRDVTPAYLQRYLSHPQVREYMLSHNSGGSRRALTKAHVESFLVAVPPPSVQLGFADVLRALDDKARANQHIADQAVRLAQALYRRESTATDRQVSLGDAGKWLSGGTPNTGVAAYWNGDIPWISSSSLKSFHIVGSDRRVTELGARNGTRRVPPGTILFVVRGMSLKSEFRVGVTHREMTFGQDTKAILPNPQIGGATLGVALFAMQEEVLTLVDEAGHGTGRLASDRMARLPIPLPAADRAAETERALSSLIARGAAAEAERSLLTCLRSALLLRLFADEVHVRELGDVVEQTA